MNTRMTKPELLNEVIALRSQVRAQSAFIRYLKNKIRKLEDGQLGATDIDDAVEILFGKLIETGKREIAHASPSNYLKISD